MSGISPSPDAIERAEAQDYASASRQLIVGAKLAGLDALTAGEVDAAPTTIYDLSADALFYDFQVIDAGEAIGTIRSAATKALGAAVVSVAGGAPAWSKQRAAAAGNRGVARADAGGERQRVLASSATPIRRSRSNSPTSLPTPPRPNG